MIEYEKFVEILETNKKLEEDLSELADIGFDFFDGKYELINHVEKILDILFSSYYDKEGVEWIYWFMYENDYGLGNNGANDKDGKQICYSYESLWEFLEENHKLKT